MGRLKIYIKKQSLKNSFMLSVLIMAAAVAALSLLTIFGCLAVQHWLVPVRDEVMLHIHSQIGEDIIESMIRMRANGEQFTAPYFIIEHDGEEVTAIGETVISYAIEPIAAPGYLSPKRKLLYNAMSFGMVALPFAYAMLGIIFCALRFHRKKLAAPLTLLMSGAQKIVDNDLDFTIQSPSNDELGVLCGAFEKMRQTLLESQRTTWALMEERRQLNASVAHDIRTPITIIEGYTQYLARNLKNGKADEETLMRTLNNLSESAARLERYVDSVRDIQNLDDLAVRKADVNLKDVLSEMMQDMSVLAAQAGKRLVINDIDLPNRQVFLDRQILSRILENLVSNSCRYAKEQIGLNFTVTDTTLAISVSDDGPGFSEKALQMATAPFYKETKASEHMGLGLAICKILCRKHGGYLQLQNSAGLGAVVSFYISIE